MLGRGGKKLINPLVAAQNFECVLALLSNACTDPSLAQVQDEQCVDAQISGTPTYERFRADILDKPTESSFGYVVRSSLLPKRVRVLTGSCSLSFPAPSLATATSRSKAALSRSASSSSHSL